MAGQQRYRQADVVEAIRAGRGLVTLAARRLGCDRGTIENYAARYPKVAAALEEARAAQLDRAEAKLFQAIDEGSLPAIMFLLRTIGRSRGYGDRTDVTLDGHLAVGAEAVDARRVLMRALADYPEARAAAAAALLAAAGTAPQHAPGVDHVHALPPARNGRDGRHG